VSWNSPKEEQKERGTQKKKVGLITNQQPFTPNTPMKAGLFPGGGKEEVRSPADFMGEKKGGAALKLPDKDLWVWGEYSVSTFLC